MNQLFISPSYVPIDSSVTLINAKIIDKLEQYGVTSTVLTMAREDTGYAITPRLSEIFHSGRKVYRVKTYERGGRFLERTRQALRRVFPIIFYVPDFHFIWELLAIGRLFRIKKEAKIDIIHSVSAPYCSHIVGYFAKKILNRPWVCHLDDFWVDQVAEHFDRYRFINRWIEARCFQKADCILSSSEEILAFAEKRYPATISSKFRFIPPCYEPKHYPDINRPTGGKYKFTYLGVFYPGKRDPYSLFSALRIIKERHPEIYGRIELSLIGIDGRTYQKAADALGIGDAVTCTGRVDYMESVRLMKEASVLVHIGYMNGKFAEDIHVSGKMFEYLGASRLIMSVTTPTGPVADFTKKNGGIVSNYHDPEDTANKIVRLISTYSIDDLHQWKNPSHVEQMYSSDAVATGYEKLFRALTNHARI